MNLDAVEKIANAVLYEGYMLYPYRKSSVKNQQRWNFGTLYPPAYVQANSQSDACSMQTECLLMGDAAVEIRVRFLQLREDGAIEREVQEQANDGTHAFNLGDAGFQGKLRVSRTRLQSCPNVTKLRIVILNTSTLQAGESADRETALLKSFVSTHTILIAHSGQFVSLLDPPDHLRDAANECRNIGTYPVLVGDSGERDKMLSSPIILYDYPQIAAESPGNLFDGTEIDEILSLRILTLTDEEKQEVRQGDAQAREILDRTEALPAEQWMKLHGALRGVPKELP